MKIKYFRIVLSSVLISVIGVLGVDYFSHLLFSDPMETWPYFWAKMTAFFLFAVLFLSLVNLKKHEFIKVALGGLTVSLLWGAYYNVLPGLLHYYPFGISLYGLTFLGMGLFGTGLAFGTVHTVAFIVGYYVSKRVLKIFGNNK